MATTAAAARTSRESAEAGGGGCTGPAGVEAEAVTPRPERCTTHVTVGAYTSTKCHYNSFGSSY